MFGVLLNTGSAPLDRWIALVFLGVSRRTAWGIEAMFFLLIERIVFFFTGVHSLLSGRLA